VSVDEDDVGKPIVEFHMVPVFWRRVAIGQFVEGRMSVSIQRLSNIQVKAVTGHAMQRAPIGASERPRIIANDVKNIVRKLHVEKLS